MSSSSTVKSNGWPSDIKTIHIRSSLDGTLQPTLFHSPSITNKIINTSRPLLVGLHTWSSGYSQSTKSEIAYGQWCISQSWYFLHPHFRGPNGRCINSINKNRKNVANDSKSFPVADYTPASQSCGSRYAIQDVIDAIHHILTRHSPYIDPNRIYLIGVSGGAHMALLLAGKIPHLWAGVSAWAPIVDLEDWWRDRDENGGRSTGRYARQIERVVGGRLDESAGAKEECKKRSPMSYLGCAGEVNLDINAGWNDGRLGGAVPFYHALRAYDAIVAPNLSNLTKGKETKERHPSSADPTLGTDFIDKFYQTRDIPNDIFNQTKDNETTRNSEPCSNQALHDPLYHPRSVIFRRCHGNTRVTIFDGGHEIIHYAALTWLSHQRRGAPAEFDGLTLSSTDKGKCEVKNRNRGECFFGVNEEERIAGD